jgi:ABC-2 type transport system permease protein
VGAATALFRAGFRQQATYRLALLNGLFTNAFFGCVQTAIFLALYRERGAVGGLDLPAVLTYTWLRQALFAIVWQNNWLFELPQRIRSGEWAVELVRPGDPLVRHFAFDLGRIAFYAVARAPWPLLVAGQLWHLDLPTDPLGIGALVLSCLLASALAAEIRWLIGSLGFWTPDYRGIFSFAFAPIYLLSGFIIPVQFFPGGLRHIALGSPVAAMLTAPIDVAVGREGWLLAQAAWIVVLWFTCRAVFNAAVRRLVVFGG